MKYIQFINYHYFHVQYSVMMKLNVHIVHVQMVERLLSMLFHLRIYHHLYILNISYIPENKDILKLKYEEIKRYLGIEHY